MSKCLGIAKLLTCLLFLTKQLVNTDENINQLTSLRKSINIFGIDVYRELIKTEDNVLISPVSLAVVLHILLVGARNKTALEIRKVLGDYDPVLKASQTLQESLHHFLKTQRRPRDSFDLELASSVWIQKTNVRSSFTSFVEKMFFADEIHVHFENRDTAKYINDWVYKATRGKITNLVSSYVSPLTKLMLINVLYFKGKWAKCFDKRLTKYQFFHSGDSKPSLVEMMKARGKFKYSESLGLDAQILELPYEGKELRMVILLPRKQDGLDQLERQLTSEMLSGTIANLTDYRIHVSLPKFVVSLAVNLKKSLASLGLRSAFVSGEADFSGIDGRHGLYVEAALQKSLLEISEEGTVAAVTTKVEIVARTISPDFTADRPFVFVIEHIPTGIFLFVGRVKTL